MQGARRRAALAACALAAVATLGCTAPAPQTPAEAKVRRIPLVNAGFESQQLASTGHPQGWIPMEHAGAQSYAFSIDDDVRRSGSKSLRIANIGPEPFATVVQKLRDPSLRGQTLRFSAWLRTQDVAGSALGGGAELMVSALASGTPVAQSRMRGAAVKRTTDWRRYEIMLAVPDRADEVEIGAILFGAGTLWLDDATLDVVSP